ncbi:Protein SAWADEE HOMEODOMAIN like [Quillaja saponaria]|uniref:Protein SAWADEE HOMEODOMAIN like n=1 Tax=Quillaja saponaria TaxID=32244 RepID=A0AAD7L5L3_QUISA|nr:Protein SAWADEE HOMEODOMAIN like [Quillaja saponaria]
METEPSFPEFTLAEIVELENIYKEVGEKSLDDQELCIELATSFSSSSNRAGKSTITREQVQEWFQNKQEELQAKVTPSPSTLGLVVDLSDASDSSNAHHSSPKRKGKAADLTELAFEAKSSKDFAWYDVASFLTYRVVSSGELEVRVRYAGFSKDEDEWVNVKRAIRERSIPLEPSECQKVEVGDLVLCFQERENYAVYCDAYVVDILRLHDRGCRCNFLVRYDHDNTEEKVMWDRLCCRPTKQESQVLPTIPLETLWG